MPFLNIEREGAILIATMNQPETRNALTGNSAATEFVALCEDVRADTSVKVVILTAAGPIFSSGGNVKDMQRFFEEAYTPEKIRQEYRQGIQRIPIALWDLETPVICAINGPAIGAGLDLACMCDIRIASDKAAFAESFVRMGIVAGDGGAWLLPRAVGMAKACEMAFTGETIDAQQALAWGLISRITTSVALMQEARALASKIAANPAAALRMTKRLIREGQAASLATTLDMAAGFQAIAHKSADHREAVMAFVEKRKPNFQ